jgi:hypothetical protein
MLAAIENRSEIRGNVHGMAKKVTPFPARSVPKTHPAAESQSSVTVHIGSQRYAIDISCKATAVPSTVATPPSCGPGVLVQTRFLRLRKAAALGGCIADGTKGKSSSL